MQTSQVLFVNSHWASYNNLRLNLLVLVDGAIIGIRTSKCRAQTRSPLVQVGFGQNASHVISVGALGSNGARVKDVRTRYRSERAVRRALLFGGARVLCMGTCGLVGTLKNSVSRICCLLPLCATHVVASCQLVIIVGELEVVFQVARYFSR